MNRITHRRTAGLGLVGGDDQIRDHEERVVSLRRGGGGGVRSASEERTSASGASGVTHLGRDYVICHVPDPGALVRGVGEGEAFDLGGDGADDGVVLLVGLPHHADVPGAGQD